MHAVFANEPNKYIFVYLDNNFSTSIEEHKLYLHWVFYKLCKCQLQTKLKKPEFVMN